MKMYELPVPKSRLVHLEFPLLCSVAGGWENMAST